MKRGQLVLKLHKQHHICHFVILYLRIFKPVRTSHLSHICHQTERDVRESLVQVATDHINPREGVSGVGTSLIQGHYMSQVR